jgi:D-alanine-D-alanine ligase
LPENLSHSRDALADEESFTTANAIRDVLINEDQVDLIRITPDKLTDLKSYDLVFNLAENTEGCLLTEEEIAKFMERNNVLFTGSGSAALKKCVDKVISKEIFLRNNLPTPNFQEFSRPDEPLSNSLVFPLIVKPAREDASIGINDDSLVYDEASLRKKIKELLQRYNEPVLAEEYIDGQEINAAVLNGEILPLSEIVFSLPAGKPKILTYESKWVTESSDYQMTVGKCPADLGSDTEMKIKELAMKAVSLMECRDYARVDFRVRDNIPYILEVNPNPCINPEGTGFLRSAKKAGYQYKDVVNKIISSALNQKSRNLQP